MDWRDGQARTAWLNNVLQRYVGDPVDYYLGPTGIPQRVNALTQAAQFTDAGDYAEAVDASRSVWNDPTLANVLRYGTAAGALAIPMVSARMMQDGVDVAGDAARSMSDDASRFWQDESGALTTGADPAVVRADEVLDLLRQGRGAEVTDEMLDMGDPVLNARMNSHLWSNYDLPMDEASRMSRAAAMTDTDAFHATRATNNFSVFEPGYRGGTYLAASPSRAESGALGGAQDLRHLSGGVPAGGNAVIPLRFSGDDVARLRPPREAWEAIPEIGFEHNIDDLSKSVGGNYWWDVFDEVEVRPPRVDESGEVADWGAYEYRRTPYPAQEYTGEVGDWRASQRRLPGWSEGSDAESLRRVEAEGQGGFLVSDEAGASVVAGPNMFLRSRFARFDPRLAHLRNLSAGLGGAAVLNGAYGDDEEERRMRELLEYLNQ